MSGEIGTTYVAGTKDPRKDTAESGGDITTFLIADGTEGDVGHAVITLPKSVSDGDKVYVEYQYETEQAIEIVNKASEFPKACSLVIYAYFRDKCDENTVYSGKIIYQDQLMNMFNGDSTKAIEYVADIFDKLGNEYAVTAADVGSALTKLHLQGHIVKHESRVWTSLLF